MTEPELTGWLQALEELNAPPGQSTKKGNHIISLRRIKPKNSTSRLRC